jgi:thiamine-monophosphate kinase
MGIKTGMDISDGFLNDLKKICVASSVNATINIDSIPVHEELKLSFPDNFKEMAVSGGEDYELLITGHESLIKYISDSTKMDLHIVGEIEIGSGHVNAVDNSGTQISITTGGWDHFTEN